MSTERKFRAGDAVYHRPSKETWGLGAVTEDGEYVFPNGWPPGRAQSSDCELKRAATDDEHRAMVRTWIEKRGDDDRTWHNRHAALALGIAEYVQVPCSHCDGSGTTKDFQVKPEPREVAP